MEVVPDLLVGTQGPAAREPELVCSPSKRFQDRLIARLNVRQPVTR